MLGQDMGVMLPVKRKSSIMDMILNSIVCYNNGEEIVEYIRKLADLRHSDLLAVSIVINDGTTSKLELQEKLGSLSIRCVVTKSDKNLGYLNGMLEGVRQYLAKHPGPIRWIIMSNTDITYPDNEFIHTLLSKGYGEDVWCIGPSVFVPHKNAFDNPVLAERRSLFDVNKTILVFSIPVVRVLYQWASCIKTRLTRTTEAESGYVYEVHGCYFIINMELYRKILERPYKSFMYSEEAFIAETVYHSGKKVFFDSDLRVEHNEHSVTGSLKLRKIARLISTSMRDIRDEFYGGGMV